ncbi:TetR/AcrR family transcriptional regulator [Nocardia sp. NBC_00565]|uniref:TetR/AcrR family transcriptional regulator n=1 Tax=Nocardia sp. NBC_00565 TaxID=2975993 RepID=UPI002E80740B|nr:helix-turn-helix domain-containing protein [Nocardia sp. NBC_00565]WUC04524.1 TetR/AcrR family transcriptional regulator [Nocardia sp. NBC_00565]
MSESAVEFPSTAWERRKIEAMSRIQQVALDLFDEHGYRNVTVERVAAAARVSPSSVYRYFGTKEMLVLYDEADPRVLDVLRTAGGGEIVEPTELVRIARLIIPVLIESLLSAESERRIRRRLQYVAAIPEIRDGQTRQMRDMADQFRLLFAERTGRDPNDLTIGMAAAAGVWGGVAALDHWAATGFTERLKDVYTQAIGAIVDSIEVMFR